MISRVESLKVKNLIFLIMMGPVPLYAHTLLLT